MSECLYLGWDTAMKADRLDAVVGEVVIGRATRSQRIAKHQRGEIGVVFQKLQQCRYNAATRGRDMVRQEKSVSVSIRAKGTQRRGSRYISERANHREVSLLWMDACARTVLIARGDFDKHLLHILQSGMGRGRQQHLCFLYNGRTHRQSEEPPTATNQPSERREVHRLRTGNSAERSFCLAAGRVALIHTDTNCPSCLGLF